MLKKFNIPFLLLALVVLLMGISHFIYFRLQKNANANHEFIFKMPLPQDIVKRYSLSNDIKIEKVVIAGNFSSWDANNDDFKMYWLDKDTWSIDLFLPPGKNNYKFVIHTKDIVYDNKDMEYRKQIWVHDQTSKHLEPDGFGGWNSSIFIPNIPEMKRVTNTALISIALLLILYLVLKPLIHHFIRLRISYRIKLVLVTGIILITSNVLYITYNMLELRFLSREAYVDETHFLLKPIFTRIKDFYSIKNIDLKSVDKDMKQLFLDTSDRIEKNKLLPNQFNISSALLLDNQLNTVAFALRPQSKKLETLHMSHTKYTNLQDFYRNIYFPQIISDLTQGKYSTYTPSFVMKKDFSDPDRPKISNGSRFYLGYDTLLIPLRNKRTLYGYAFFTLHTELLGLEVRRILKFNILMMVFILILMYFLLYDLGGMLSMEEEALMDGLTGVFNRRGLDGLLSHEILRERRTQKPLGLIILDLDHFKKINDTLGHLGGDIVLTEAVKVITKSIRRPADEIGRYGGEEFCIILPNTEIQGVKQVAETIRKNFIKHEFVVDKKKIKVRASMGCYAEIPDMNTTIKHFYGRSDEALYQAKRHGRNKVVVWGPQSDNTGKENSRRKSD